VKTTVCIASPRGERYDVAQRAVAVRYVHDGVGGVIAIRGREFRALFLDKRDRSP
jgi:hypothetical protein